MTDTLSIQRSATLSADEVYRYTLERIWDRTRELGVFVGLNPSTADAEVDDPTIRRCTGFAQRWNLGGFVMLNLFAVRATDPALLPIWAKKGRDVVGPETDAHMKRVLLETRGPIVAAWGAHPTARKLQAPGPHEPRETQVLKLLRDYAPGREVLCFGTTSTGAPKHPLYLRADAAIRAYTHLAP